VKLKPFKQVQHKFERNIFDILFSRTLPPPNYLVYFLNYPVVRLN
jgi:hypothetical protein